MKISMATLSNQQWKNGPRLFLDSLADWGQGFGYNLATAPGSCGGTKHLDADVSPLLYLTDGLTELPSVPASQ